MTSLQHTTGNVLYKKICSTHLQKAKIYQDVRQKVVMFVYKLNFWERGGGGVGWGWGYMGGNDFSDKSRHLTPLLSDPSHLVSDPSVLYPTPPQHAINIQLREGWGYSEVRDLNPLDGDRESICGRKTICIS